ncbi:MAG TPA: right-handed parallel beta-helix repeat-containing protein [Phyllobacterium sp.]|nr:right-handed parallel beta-helix repeat-containing protein [Phyllobacterium sp.]
MSWRILLATIAIAVALSSLALAQESANGTTVPTAPQITDNRDAIWTLRLSDRAVLKDGKETGIADILQLWYLDHQVWAFSGTQWSRWSEKWQTVETNTWPQKPPLPTTPGLRLPVGLQTDVSCKGVSVRPGTDLQSLVNANPAGTTFCLAIGTYNQQSVRPKNGNVFIGAYDGINGAVLDGQSRTTYAFHGTAHHVVIKNLIVKNYTAPQQYGMIQVWGPYALIQNNEITGATQGAGVWASSYALVIANNIHNNAQEGYKAVYDATASQPAVGALFDSNEIAYNNPTHRYWDSGEQGGGKATNTQHLTFWYNYAHDNGGPSFWTDSNNLYTIYWFNRSRNDTNGIEHEISFNASIIGNDLQDMGSQSHQSTCPSFYFSCAGIAIENSGGLTGRFAGIIEIAYNTIKPGQYGRAITIREQHRGECGRCGYTTDPYWVRNIWVHHNTVDVTNGLKNEPMIGAVEDAGNQQIFSSRNIKFDYNDYTGFGTTHFFAWRDSAFYDFARWQRFGQDTHSAMH